MAEYRTVCAESELLPGTGRRIEADGLPIAVFNVDGTHYAIEGTCLHAGGPIHEGSVVGTIVTCPWHQWEFDLTDGSCGLHRGALKCFPTRVVDGVVEVLA